MRLAVNHSTTYTYSEPARRVIQLLRVTPSNFTGQSVLDWRIDVDCDAKLREGRDGYGNVTHMLYVDRPVPSLTITVAGRDTSALTESQFAALRHDTIGFIFQTYNLIPFLSAVENVELPLMFEPYDRKALRKRAMELLELVGLSHRVHHQPTKMSGGEQQRTAIARSLISNPTLVLADEPTANLDHKTGETVVRMLRDLCSTMGVTVVASTHDPIVAEEASRVVRMRDGQIVS